MSMADQALGFGELRRRHFDLGVGGHRGRAPLFDVLLRQRAGRFHALRTAVFGRRELRIRPRFIERGGQPRHLRLQNGFIDLRKQLTCFDVITGFDIDG